MTKRVSIAQGFRFSGIWGGIKVNRRDLALIVSERPCAAAGVVTQNQARAACASRTARLLPRDDLQAIVVNSGNANCLSGPQEAEHDEQMAESVAHELGLQRDAVLTASTGPIGQMLPIEQICAAVPQLIRALSADPFDAAEAMMTTDLVPKLASRQLEIEGKTVTVTGLAKGSGMIHPNMATMLAFICTDAAIDAHGVGTVLRAAVAGSFNQVSVDRDTSTNDMAVMLANGASGVAVSPDSVSFSRAVYEVCEELAKMMAADGEGATRLIVVELTGAPTEDAARRLARAPVEGNLFKCAVYGDSPGVGRFLAALGAKAGELGISLRRDALTLDVNGVRVYDGGHPTGREVSVRGPEVHYQIDLGLGDATARAWGCDFSYDYVSINAVSKGDSLDTHSPGLKRRLLVEALSYIRSFKGRVAVIKYGGAAMLRDDLKDAFAEDLVLLNAVGLKPVVVHGGGPEISRTFERLGEPVQFIDGQRVTDPSTIKIVEMVLTGSVNTDVVTRIHMHGGRAVGLSGKDSSLLMAKKWINDGPDLGMVGEVTAVNTDVITLLLDAGYIPVISPIGIDEHGLTYNINADTVASEVAVALAAEKVIFLTDVPGILKDGELQSQLSPQQLLALIDSGVVSGGMVPKAQAMLRATQNGVKSAHIIDGRVRHNLLAELFTQNGVGTWVTERGE